MPEAEPVSVREPRVWPVPAAQPEVPVALPGVPAVQEPGLGLLAQAPVAAEVLRAGQAQLQVPGQQAVQVRLPARQVVRLVVQVPVLPRAQQVVLAVRPLRPVRAASHLDPF